MIGTASYFEGHNCYSALQEKILKLEAQNAELKAENAMLKLQPAAQQGPVTNKLCSNNHRLAWIAHKDRRVG